jgi:hypothetical protein
MKLGGDDKVLAAASKHLDASEMKQLFRAFDAAAPSDEALFDVYVLAKNAKKTIPFTALSTTAEPSARGFARCERSRVGGPGPGLSTAPIGPDKRPMVHLATLFADEIPGLGLSGENVAVAVYLSDPMNHEADKPGNKHAVVVLLDRKTAEAPLAAVSDRDLEVQRLLAATLAVPVKPDQDQYGQATASLAGFAGGVPSWVQDDEGRKKDGRFLFQGNDELLPINLGDGGTFYVYEKTAFFQCS